MAEDNHNAGFYGPIVTHATLPFMVEAVFGLNEGQPPHDRSTVCIWGHAGIGKTQALMDLKTREVFWGGKLHAGYKIQVVPLAQFEEMGDLQGMPDRNVLVRKENVSRWVPVEVIEACVADGWRVDPDVGTRTINSPYPWVPDEEGPGVLVLDDWNRASGRVIKGSMQLFQTFSTVSWSLPEGWSLAVTGNPDEQDYHVTSVDSAVLSRMAHFVLREDVKTWAAWALSQGLDERGVSFLLGYKELLAQVGSERTNPRNWAKVFRYTKGKDVVGPMGENVSAIAHALVDEGPASSMMRYLQDELDRDVVDAVSMDPSEILVDAKKALARVRPVMERDEPRIDVMSVVTDRLTSCIIDVGMPVEKAGDKDPRTIEFRKFVEDEVVGDEMLNSVCMRIHDRMERDAAAGWILGSKRLRERMADLY